MREAEACPRQKAREDGLRGNRETHEQERGKLSQLQGGVGSADEGCGQNKGTKTAGGITTLGRAGEGGRAEERRSSDLAQGVGGRL